MDDIAAKTRQKFIAKRALPSSAMRSQGEGTLGEVREYCQDLDLGTFEVTSERLFLVELDQATEDLSGRLCPKNWGAARKALNLFLRDVMYDACLPVHHKLEGSLLCWLELPLDSRSVRFIKSEGKAIAKQDGTCKLPLAPKGKFTIRDLVKPQSNQLQKYASVVASHKGYKRVELDEEAWGGK